MKLRNKKTGKVVEALISAYGISGDVAVSEMDSNAESGYTDLGRYETLAELNADWEDYEPKEPLIKDESVRKQLRKWANCYGYRKVLAHSTLRQFWSLDGEMTLEIYDDYDSDNLIEDGEYTIEELCGEKEE